jgi:regulatory protein YycH of two-component signal transduction system YycFG
LYLKNTIRLNVISEVHESLNNKSDDELLRIVKDELDRLQTTDISVYESKRSVYTPTRQYLFRRLKINKWSYILEKIKLLE